MEVTMRAIAVVVVGFGLLGAACAPTGEGEDVEARQSAVATKGVVCHMPGAHQQELEVAASAVPAHLAHGDTSGHCDDGTGGPCAGKADGTACDDGNSCTDGDACHAGACTSGAQRTCLSDDTCRVGACDRATGACVFSQAADGTSCNDNLACTTSDTCHAGICYGKGPGELAPGETKTFTCPATAEAIDGIVQPSSCMFDLSSAYNNLFTGPVLLSSHLDRWFANYDVNPLGDGRIQIMCVYHNADGLQIAGTSGFATATSCTATTADSFVCTN
jgi:hypothetical protein